MTSSIVLCASFPAGDRGEAVAPYFSSDIAGAVSSVAEAVLRSSAQLTYGAHPTISPIVLEVARVLRAGRRVRIVQSAYFEDQTTDDVRRLVSDLGADLQVVPAVAGDRDKSLTKMREAMLRDAPLASFFCGGMEGLVEEFELAGRAGTARFLITEPGGMTARLAREAEAPSATHPGPAETRLLPGRAYSSLALQALESLGLRQPAGRDPGAAAPGEESSAEGSSEE